MPDKNQKTARSFRVYEYVDTHGVVFWSLAKLPGISTRRIELVDNRGMHFREHISEIHELTYQADVLKNDSES